MNNCTPPNILPIAVILCRPEISRNIGAVCRAMANNDCQDLRIVGNKNDYDEQEILRLAIHAGYIWQNAQFFEASIHGLEQAAADCGIIAGTTRRTGEKRKSWGMTPENFAEFIKTAPKGRIGVVFGNERTGLTDAELAICSLALNIPSSKSFPSLNLSHAVQLVCYTLFRTYSPYKYGYERISYGEISAAAENISGYLCKIGLFRHGGREDNVLFFKEVIARAGLSVREARYFENLFKKLYYIKCQNAELKQQPPPLLKKPHVPSS